MGVQRGLDLVNIWGAGEKTQPAQGPNLVTRALPLHVDMAQQQELDEIRAQIQLHMVSLGTYELINQQLKLLLYELGWYKKVSQLAETQMRQDARGTPKFDELVGAVQPSAEAVVPESVKEETMQRIREYLKDVIH